MRYLPHTKDEIRSMLERIGVDSIDTLFDAIPEQYRVKGNLALEPSLDEAALMRHLEELARKNTAVEQLRFLGGGMYDHHIPPAVDQLLTRSEFYTAYTPYQAEVSQGTLQCVFEFQTMVCELFGQEVANASLYDAASGVAEAVLMARRIAKKRNRCVISGALHPEYLQTLKTYLHNLDHGASTIDVAPVTAEGTTDWQAVRTLLTDEHACLVVGYPNFFGCVEDLEQARAIADEKGALLVTATSEAYALSLLKPPGAFGADICVGEGQSLAVPPQLGGPGVGLFACKQKYLRQIPGRLCGQTVDESDKRGFVLTLSTREQHIRRERATSNICTNQGLIALAFTIRTAMLGRQGFESVGTLCLSKSEYLKGKIDALEHFEVAFKTPSFNEFVVRAKHQKASSLLDKLASQGILGGIDLGRFFEGRENEFLVAVTERHQREDLDRFVDALASI